MDLKTFLENFDTIAEAPGGIKKLRSLILDLAVRGKLASQDLEDEPASYIIKRALDKRNHLTEAKKIYKRESQPSLREDEFPFVLPKGWQCVRFGEIADIASGVTKGRKLEGRKTVSYPYLRVANVQRWFLDLEVMKEIEVLEEEIDKYKLQTGDVLLTEGGDWDKLGRSAIWRGEIPECVHQNHIFRARAFDSGLLSQWIVLFTNSLIGRRYFESAAKRTTNLASINMTQLRFCPFPVPPAEEQKRIVEKVDELMGMCDQLEAAQQERESLRQKLRKSAIDALMNADDESLEKEWAIVHDNWHILSQSPEDVGDLRRSILQLAIQGKLIPHSNVFRKTLSNFLSFQNGYAFKSEWYQHSGVRLVRNQNIGHGILRWQDVKYVGTQKAKEFERFFLYEGDIVISLDRPIINTGLKLARINAQDVPSLLLQRVARPLFKGNSLSSEYLFMWMNSPEFIEAIDPGRSNGVPHISTNSLEKIEILVPSIAEQKRIVEKVDELMETCAHLEESLRQTQQQAAALAASAINHLTV